MGPRLSAYIATHFGVTIPSHFLFDVQVKRIHEYKRQLLNILYTIHRYMVIKAMKPEERAQLVPRAVMIGGKAAPGYFMAKRIIKLICVVSSVVNADEAVSP